MKEMNQLWQERVNDYWSMALRYWRLIGNSGLIFTMYILLIAGGYYYHQWLQSLPAAFPAAVILCFIFSVFLIRSPIRTFLKHADLVFLLPLEDDMSLYFSKSIRYSYLLQSVTIAIIFIVLSPLYLDRINAKPLSLLITFVLLVITKIWNSYCSWSEKFLTDERSIVFYSMIRGLVSVIFTYLLFKQASVIVIALLLLLMYGMYVFIYRPIGGRSTLKWERLIEMDERMLLLFLKLANLFTDVPRLRSRVKPRKWMNIFLGGLPYQQKAVFKHFYLKTFFRANDYFGIYLRLIIIGGIIIFFLPGMYAKLIFLFLFMYLTGIQLLTLWKHDIPQALGELYPIRLETRQENFVSIIFVLLIIQGVIFGVIGFFSGSWLLILAGLSFSLLFSYGVVKNRIKKQDVPRVA